MRRKGAGLHVERGRPQGQRPFAGWLQRGGYEQDFGQFLLEIRNDKMLSMLIISFLKVHQVLFREGMDVEPLLIVHLKNGFSILDNEHKLCLTMR